MAVSADIYLLPVAVFDSLEELALWDNCSVNTLKKKISKHIKSKNCFFEVVLVKKTKKFKNFNT